MKNYHDKIVSRTTSMLSHLMNNIVAAFETAMTQKEEDYRL